MAENRDDSEEYEVVHFDSVLGWGGMVIGPDGQGQPMPEAEALAAVIPDFVGVPEHLLDNAVAICLDALGRPELPVRIAALQAFAEIARRYRYLPQRETVIDAVENARRDPAAEVRQVAAATAQALQEALDK